MEPDQVSSTTNWRRFLRLPAWTPLSPWKHLAITICVVFFSEVAAMSLVTSVSGLPIVLATLLDAVIMTVLAFPILYALSYRPLLEDISQRQRTEDALRQAQAEQLRSQAEREAHLRRLEVLIDASHRILAETTTDGVLQRFTEAARTITGARHCVIGHLTSAGGSADGAAAHPDGLMAWRLGDTIRIASGGVVAETLGRRPSIRLSDEELRADPLWGSLLQGRPSLRGLLGTRLVDRDGAPRSMVILSDKEAGDFTAEDEAALAPLAVLASLGLQHIEARTEAQEKAAELDAVFDAMAEPVLINDRNGTLQKANPAAVEVFGSDPTGAKLTEALATLSARDPNGEAVKITPAPAGHPRAGGSAAGQRIHLTTASGREAVVVATSSPLRTAGTDLGFVTVWHDVTELETAETELRAALGRAERRQAEVAALLAGARSVLEHHDFETAAGSIFASCRGLIGAAAGYIALVSADRTQNELVYLDAGDIPCTVDRSLAMPIRGLRAVAVQTGTTVVDNRFEGSDWSQFIPTGHAALDNVLFAPLMLDGVVVGLLGLANKPGGFGERDVRMATAFGELAAVALLNSRTEQDLRDARDALEARVAERTEQLERTNTELRAEIADRERVELALRDSEDRYRTFLQNFQGIAFRASLGVAPIFFHGAVHAITGYSEEDLLAGTPHWLEIIHPDDLAEATASMERVRSTPGYSTEREYRIVRKDGQVRWLREYIQNTRDASGEPTLIQGTVNDITDRMMAERHKAATHALLELFAQKTSRQEYLDAVVALIREWTATQCAGIRLRDARGDDTFEAHVGFDHSFLDSECWLPGHCACPCSRVIMGTPDPHDLPMTTAAGSFHCSDIRGFLESLTPDGLARYQGSCLGRRFGSVGIVPIRCRGRVLGAVHVADGRLDAITPVTIAFVETVVALIGEAVQRFNLEEELRRFAKEQSVLYAVATAATSFLDPTSLLDAVMEVLLPAVDTDAGWVTIPGPTAADPPRVAVSYGVPSDFLQAESSVTLATCPSCSPLLCGDVMAEAPRLLADCPRLAAGVLASSGLHSHVSVPLNAGGELLGILNIAWREPHDYPPAERTMLRAVGDLVGIALANARLFKTAHDRARDLATLNGIGQAIGSSLDVDQVLLTLIDEVRRAIGAEAGLVALADGETGELVYRHVAGAADAGMLGIRVRPGNGIAGWVLDNRQAVVVNAGDPASPLELEIRTCAGSPVNGSVAAPLLVRDRVVGIVELCHKHEGVFTPADAQLLESAAAAAAVAVENANLFNQVRTERERLRVLSRRLVEVQEAERMAVARELHDDAGQTLTALMVGLRLLEREAGDAGAVIQRVEELKHTADGVLENLHRLAANLRPASLDHLGLVATLRQDAQTLNAGSGLAVSFEANGLDAPRLAPAVETALYRIAQEAINNAIRHAEAGRVNVRLDRNDERVIMAIEDDGIGFDLEAASRGRRLGLVGMRERVEMLGGRLHLQSSPGAGTAVRVEVPCADSHPVSR